MKRLLLVLRIFTLLLGVTCGGGSAWGNAVVVDSVPRDGEVLARAPGQITVRFSETIDPGATRLFLSDMRGFGLALPVQPKAFGPTDHLTVVLPLLGRGSYILRYRVVAADGTPTHGSVSFTAGGH